MWAQLSFPVHIDQTSDLSFLLRRLYSVSSIVIFFPSTVCCSSMKDQKNIFNIFLCFTTLLLRKAISRHGKKSYYLIYICSEFYYSISPLMSWFFSVTMELYVSSYCDSISESFTYNPNFTTRQRQYHTYLTQRTQRYQDTEKTSACTSAKKSLPWLKKEFLIKWVRLKHGMLILPSQETKDTNFHLFPTLTLSPNTETERKSWLLKSFIFPWGH